MQRALSQFMQRLSPVHLAFWGSLLLSWIAVSGETTLSKDAALYIDLARSFFDQGAAQTLQRFNWPWFAWLLGVTHWLTGIPLETCGYLWCALLLAGTCALLVDCVLQRAPHASYWAVLVVLAMPSFNVFRGDILREYGFWFFSVLALWLALRWELRGGWWRASGIQLAIFTAALFRLEALMLSAAVSLWLLPELRSRSGWLRLLQLNLLPILCLIFVLLWLLGSHGASQKRVNAFLKLLSPSGLVLAFQTLTEQFSGTLKAKYSKDDAGQIIFFGLLAAILFKFIKILGPFMLPFLVRKSWGTLATYRQKFAPFMWAWLLYLVVLMVFFIQQQFINSRYVSFLDLLAVPLVAIAAAVFAGTFPRLGKLLMVLALLVMLDNVISLGAKKTHYIEAGHWLAQNIDSADQVYAQDPRMIYYAGWVYPRKTVSLAKAMSPEGLERYRYYLVEADEQEPWLQDWMSKQGKKVLAKFSNRRGDTVVVLGD